MSKIIYKRHITFKVIDCCVDCANFTQYNGHSFCISKNKYIENLRPIPTWCSLRTCTRKGEIIDDEDEFEEDIRRIRI